MQAPLTITDLTLSVPFLSLCADAVAPVSNTTSASQLNFNSASASLALFVLLVCLPSFFTCAACSSSP